MLYKQFRIKNFKGISEVTIDLSENRIVTLVGLNESGKTTIMEAMQFFHKAMKGGERTAYQLNQIRPKGHAFTGDIEIEADLFLENEDVVKLRKCWKELGHTKTDLVIANDFTYKFKFSFHMNNHSGTVKEPKWTIKIHGSNKSVSENDLKALLGCVKKELLPEILYYSDFVFEIPEEVYFDMSEEEEEEVVPAPPQPGQSAPRPQQPTAEEKRNRDWQLVFDDILKSVDSEYSSFQKDVAAKWFTDSSTASNRKSYMEVQLNQKITAAWKALFQHADRKLHFKEITLKCEPDTEENKLRVSFEVKTDTGKVFSINDRSKGCKWFFSFLLFTEFRKNRTKNILFLLDEPASNLHSSAQAKILNAIGELSEKALVVYSTHSHHLVKIEWLAGAYVVINEILTESELEGNLNIEDKAKISAKKYYTYVGEGLGSDNVSYVQPILDALEYQPSVVEPTPELVVTEGKNDWYTFKYFNDIIFSGKHKIHLYPGAGADKLHEIIRLYLAWGKKFIVLLDGDKAGEKAKANYIKDYGDLLKDKVFTINDAITKPVATEGLIASADQELLVDTAVGQGSYSKLKSRPSEAIKSSLNKAINQLLVEKKSVTLSKGTKDAFDELFAFMSLKIK